MTIQEGIGNVATEHPIVPLALIIAITTLVVGLSAKNSFWRPVGLLWVVSLIYVTAATIQQSRIRAPYKMTIAASVFAFALHYLDIALLSRWSFDAGGPTSNLGGHTLLRVERPDSKLSEKPWTSVFMSKLKFGLTQTFQGRLPRTPREKNGGWEKNVSGVVPTRKQFLGRAGLRFLAAILVLDVVDFAGRDVSLNHISFDSSRVPFFSRLQDVTSEELILRVVTSVVLGVTVACIFQVVYYGTALVAIGLGIDRIENWPPLFGRLADTWSIRQFWNSSWHQIARQTFSAPAHFVCFSLLRLTKGTIIARCTFLSLTFLVSGITHHYGDVGSGVPWNESGAVFFFSIQPVGIVIEDAVQALYRLAMGRKRTPEKPSGWKVGLGFLWVSFWLCWTTPTWLYPNARRSDGEGFLPFTILGHILK